MQQVLSPSADGVFKPMLAHVDVIVQQALVHGQSPNGTSAEQGTMQLARPLLVGLQACRAACSPTLLRSLWVCWASGDVEAGWNWLCLQCKGEYTAVRTHCPFFTLSNQGLGVA